MRVFCFNVGIQDAAIPGKKRTATHRTSHLVAGGVNTKKTHANIPLSNPPFADLNELKSEADSTRGAAMPPSGC